MCMLAAQEDGVCEEPGLLRQLELLRTAKLMRLAFICQDLADGLMAVNDITGRCGGQCEVSSCSLVIRCVVWCGGECESYGHGD